jgi:hypothetical protein
VYVLTNSRKFPTVCSTFVDICTVIVTINILSSLCKGVKVVILPNFNQIWNVLTLEKVRDMKFHENLSGESH